jgi:hypothetical protein
MEKHHIHQSRDELKGHASKWTVVPSPFVSSKSKFWDDIIPLFFGHGTYVDVDVRILHSFYRDSETG